MRLIDELRAEHDLIDQVLGSLHSFVEQRMRGQGNSSDGLLFLRFFRLYAGDFHHAREEDSLFAALSDHLELPADRGPIAALMHDHCAFSGILDRIELSLTNDADALELQAAVKQYSHALWRHIDAENSVLLPESEARLRKHGIVELTSRPMKEQERAAMACGEDLLRRYPPTVDRELIRGDGCVMCPAFVESCSGLEHEWWNDWEWDEFEDHLPSG